MWKDFWLWLELKGWPYRVVGWTLRRRARSRLGAILFPRSSATAGISLFVAAPNVSMQDLVEAVIPKSFGAWRDYRVLRSTSTRHTAAAVLVDPREKTEFTITVPVHAGFPWRDFAKLRVLRITCESERAAMLSVREPNGRLIASGTLELIPRASFSRKVRAS